MILSFIVDAKLYISRFQSTRIRAVKEQADSQWGEIFLEEYFGFFESI